MKISRPHFTPLLSLALALPLIARAADESKPATNDDKKKLRVIVQSDHDNAHSFSKTAPRAFAFHAGEGEKESVTFLGVETSPASSTLSAQLGLPEGSGLVVNRLVPESPADSALKQHDILLKLDDQILVDQHQLSVLIRQHKEGDEVTVTYVRAGKQATARVKLGKHEVPKMTMLFENAFPNGNGVQFSDGKFEYAAPFSDGADRREEVDRVLSLIQRGPGPADLAPDSAAGFVHSAPRVQIERKAAPGIRAISVNPGNSSIVFSDDAGSLELTLKDGKKSLMAKDANGGQVFSGPVTTPEERKALPADVRGRLEKLEGMHNITFRTDGDFQGSETRVLQPFEGGIAYPEPMPPPRPATFY